MIKDQQIQYKLEVDSGYYSLAAFDKSQRKSDMLFNLNTRPFDEIPEYHLKYSLHDQYLPDLLEPYREENFLDGYIDADFDIFLKGRTEKELLASINGSAIISGDSLLILGIDIDDLIKKFERSQSFNLLDLGAVVVAGPVGIVYTKGSEYALMLTANKGESSEVAEFYSHWEIVDGNMMIDDLALSTLENRIAAKGWIDMKRDSIDLTIAVVDQLGCSVISQNMAGHIDDPESGRVKVVKTIMAPVTNLVNDILDKDCDVFYDGKVKPPGEKGD